MYPCYIPVLGELKGSRSYKTYPLQKYNFFLKCKALTEIFSESPPTLVNRLLHYQCFRIQNDAFRSQQFHNIMAYGEMLYIHGFLAQTG